MKDDFKYTSANRHYDLKALKDIFQVKNPARKVGSSVWSNRSTAARWMSVFEVEHTAVGDGTCFFYSFSYALFGDELYYPLFRGLVCPLLWNLTVPEREALEESAGVGSFAAMLDQLYHLHWNGHAMEPLFCVLAWFFNCDIVIVDMNKFVALRIGRENAIMKLVGLAVQEAAPRTVYLALYDAHYNGMLL